MTTVSAAPDMAPGSGQWRYRWTHALLLLAACALAVVALLWPSVLSISRIWFSSDTYQHGVAMVPLALFLAWTRRDRLAAVAPVPSLWGLAWLSAAGVAWILARSVDVKLVQHFALIAMIPGLVLALFGTHVARILVFPLSYVFLAVPFGAFIVPRLQEYTAWFSVMMIRLSGIPVHQDGYYISIPAGDFVVGEVCSGVRYLIASVALGLVYAYISYRSPWRRLALVALAVLLPIIANGLRAYGIIMIAHWTDMRHAVGVDHIIYGWFFFGVVMVLLFWIGSFWWERNYRPMALTGGLPAQAPSAPVRAGLMAVMLVALGLILAAPRAGDAWMSQRAAAVARDVTPEVPAFLAGWRGPEAVSGAWGPRFVDFDRVVTGLYRHVNPDALPGVELHVYQYVNRGEGTEIASWRNRVYDGRNWRRSSERRASVPRADGSSLDVNETVLVGAAETRLVWHWYQVGDHVTPNDVVLKLRESEAVLRGDGRGALIIAVSAADTGTPGQIRAVLRDFISALSLPLAFAPHE